MNQISFKRHTFYDITKKQTLINILTDSSLIIKNNILKNFTVHDVSTPDNLKNNSIIFLNDDMINKFSLNIYNKIDYKIHVIIESKNFLNKKISSYTLVNNLKSAYNILLII